MVPIRRKNIRIIGPFIGLWFLIFSFPSFIYIKEKRTKRRSLTRTETTDVI